MHFAATLSNLPAIMDYIRQEGQALAMDEKMLHKIEVSVEEVIVNIISYAYPETKGGLDVECSCKGSRFEILIVDEGIPFNPVDEEIHPQTNLPVQERRIGGFGIFLMRKLIDEATYERKNNKNILCLEFTLNI